MFENMTYEYLLQSMMDRVPNTFDKREGSIIHNTLAPTAIELQELYILLDIILDEGFAENASYDFLRKKCSECGIAPKLATNAIAKGEFNIDVQIGSRFSLDNLNYVVIEKISTGIFKLKCETPGPILNLGKLIPIEYIEGLETAELTGILTNGEDDEYIESLRQRYFEYVRETPTSGNASHYKIWAKEVSGVGDAKVFPLWNGRNTVKVVIINSAKKAASNDLIKNTFDHIESVRPIGGDVTVVTVQEKNINISTTLTLAKGYSLNTIQEDIKNNIDKYFEEVIFNAGYVSIAKVGNLLLNTEGVLDYSNLKINNITSNIQLEVEEIPVIGTLTLEV